jgi:hypothetical protein
MSGSTAMAASQTPKLANKSAQLWPDPAVIQKAFQGALKTPLRAALQVATLVAIQVIYCPVIPGTWHAVQAESTP